MVEIIEEIYQGYCRAIDASRMVTCEYKKEKDTLKLEYTDCNYGPCVHSKTCKIMEQAHTETKE